MRFLFIPRAAKAGMALLLLTQLFVFAPAHATCISPPSSVNAGPLSCDTLKVNWSFVSGASSYKIVVSTSSTFATQISGSPFTATGLTYKVAGLSSGTTYYIKMYSVNGTCASPTYSSTATATTAGAPVTYIPPSFLTCSSARISWGAVPGASSYNIYLGDNLFASGITSLTYDVTGLSASTLYSYGVEVVSSRPSCNLMTSDFFTTPSCKSSGAAPAKLATADNKAVNSNKQASDVKITVSPNPSTGNIVFSSNSDAAMGYKLMDLQGRLLQEGTVSNGNLIDIEAQPAGIYLLRVLNEQGLLIEQLRLMKK